MNFFAICSSDNYFNHIKCLNSDVVLAVSSTASSCVLAFCLQKEKNMRKTKHAGFVAECCCMFREPSDFSWT